jgi:hypothetical protein
MASTKVSSPNKEKWKAKYILQDMETESNIKSTIGKTLAQVGLSVLVGGGVGAVIGRPAFFLGLGLTAFGYYKDVSWVPPIGIGMMASSHIFSSTLGGFDLKTETEDAKTRLVNFKDTLFKKTYLDKIFKSKSAETTEGIGSIGPEESLAQIEQQLINSAMDYKRQRGESTSGIEDEIHGTEENIHGTEEDMQGTDEPDFSGM